MYAGDELYDDDVTSGMVDDPPASEEEMDAFAEDNAADMAARREEEAR